MKNNEFTADNYVREELKFNPVNEQLFSVLVLVIAVIVFGAPFLLIWFDSWQILFDNLGAGLENRILNIGIITVVFILGVIVHKLLHGIFYAIFTKHGFKATKFGVGKGYAYCETREIMRTKHFIVGLMVPMIILGIIPSIVSIFTGNVNLLAFGIVFTAAGAGDTLILTRIFRDRNETWFENLPSILEWNVYRPIRN